MRRIYLKAWWGVLCSGRKCLRTESRRDIAEILQAKLATIIEEDTEGLLMTPINELSHNHIIREDSSQECVKLQQRIKISKYFKSESNLREFCEMITTGLSTKTSFAIAGLIRN